MDKKKVIEQLDSANNPHILYLVVLEGNDELFCKIGVTSKDVNSRFKDEIDYKIIKSTTIRFNSGIEARGFESLLLEQILDYNRKYKPLKRFGGYSECYDANYYRDMSLILQCIEEHVFGDEEIINKFDYENLRGLDYQIGLIKGMLLSDNILSELIPIFDINYIEDEYLKIIYKDIVDMSILDEVKPTIINLKIKYNLDSSMSEFSKAFLKTQLDKIDKYPAIDAYKFSKVWLEFCKKNKKVFFLEKLNITSSNSVDRLNFVLSKLEEIKNKPIDDKQSYNSVQVQSNRFKGIFCEKRYGSEIWYKDGVRHRDDDLPAIIQSNGTKKWYKNGKQHRDNDLPAVIEKNGTKRWYKDGKQHRDNGPAIIFAKGVEHWFKNGVKIEPITQDINLISKEN